jgi:hypothetical protein
VFDSPGQGSNARLIGGKQPLLYSRQIVLKNGVPADSSACTASAKMPFPTIPAVDEDVLLVFDWAELLGRLMGNQVLVSVRLRIEGKPSSG